MIYKVSSNLLFFSSFYFLQFITISGYICNSNVSVNQSPVIGVLAQEIYNDGSEPNNSFIVASYVKFLEFAGAQVVPVLLNKKDDYYSNLYGKLNGLLLPGGSLFNDSIYFKTAKLFWQKATNNNSKLDWRPFKERMENYFPIWGTCLGYEFMFEFIAGESRLTSCNAYDTSEKVHLTKSNQKLRKYSKLFRNATSKILNWLRNKETTANFHHLCMSTENLTKYNLNKNVRILGKNRDKDGLNYVSIIESKFYPMYGVQFHPEKILFEFKDFKEQHHIPHSIESIIVSQYFSNFFVEETRKNKNCFSSQEELNTYSIHNYQPEFTGKTSGCTQKYFFPI